MGWKQNQGRWKNIDLEAHVVPITFPNKDLITEKGENPEIMNMRTLDHDW